MIRLIDRKLLDEVSSEAQNSPRLRKNRNFHASDDALHLPATFHLQAVWAIIAKARRI